MDRSLDGPWAVLLQWLCSLLRDLPREGPAERPRIPAQVTPAHVPAHVPEICFETGRTYIDFQTEFGISGISVMEIYIDFDWARPATAGPASSRWASRLAWWRSTSLSWWRSTSSRSAPRWAQGHRHRSLHQDILELVEVYLFEICIEIGPCTDVITEFL